MSSFIVKGHLARDTNENSELYEICKRSGRNNNPIDELGPYLTVPLKRLFAPLSLATISSLGIKHRPCSKPLAGILFFYLYVTWLSKCYHSEDDIYWNKYSIGSFAHCQTSCPRWLGLGDQKLYQCTQDVGSCIGIV